MNATLIRTLLTLLAGLILAQAEETSPELKKIDERLDELRTIWRQEQAIINGYTKNRTVPVREGSAEYHACLKASQRIQQAESEAAELKKKRALIVDGKTVSGNANSSLAYAEREFDVEDAKKSSEVQKNNTVVFKGFYVGMPAGDALGLLNHYLDLPQAAADAVEPLEQEAIERLRDAMNVEGKMDRYPYRIFSREEARFIALHPHYNQPFALINAEGKVTEFIVSKKIRDALFGSPKATLAEFISDFCSAYGIPAPEMNLIELKSFDGSLLGSQTAYIHRDQKRGYEVSFYADKDLYRESTTDVHWMMGMQGGPAEGFTLKSIKTASERKKAFD